MSRKLLLLTVLFCLLWPADGPAGPPGPAGGPKGRPRRENPLRRLKPNAWSAKWKGKEIYHGKSFKDLWRCPRHHTKTTVGGKRNPVKEYEPPVKPLGGGDEYRAGVAAMGRLDYRMAIKLFKVVIACYRGRYVGRAESRLREIEQLARQKMALYEQLWGQGREEEAIRVLAEVAEKFDGSGTATTAKRKLLQFAETPGLAETVRKARAEGAAGFRGRMRRRLRAAESDVPEQETVAAEQDTREVREPGAQDKCNRLLSLAANYRLNRHLEAARPAYKEVIELYPEDELAGKAEEELRAVEKEMEEAGK